MEITKGKLLSLVVAALCIVAYSIIDGSLGVGLLKGSTIAVGPLILIWFPDELGAFKGYVGRGGNIQTETPPIYVTVIGWIFLFGIPVVSYMLRTTVE